MKKLLLIFTAILLTSTTLSAQQPFKELENWAAQQTGNINAGEVVEFLNGGRAAGDITFGGEYVFNASSSQHISALRLDSCRFVIAYMDEQNSWRGVCVVGNVSGDTIIYGSPFVFNSSSAFNISAAILDSTHFILAFKDCISSCYGAAIVGTVSGNNIVYGAKKVFNSGSADGMSIKSSGTSGFMIAYSGYNSGYYGAAVAGSVAGDVISVGNEYVFNNGFISDVSVANIDTSHYIISFKDGSNSGYGTSIVSTVTGLSISFGPKNIFNNSATEAISSSRIDASRFVIGYKDNGNSRNGTAIIGTISGNNISFGLEYIFNPFMTDYISVSLLNDNQIIIAYDDADFTYSHYGSAILGTISGSAVSFGNEYVFSTDRTYWSTVAALDVDKFVVVYMDEGNNYAGTAIIGKLEIPPPPPIPLTNWPILLAVVLMGAVLWKRMI